MCLQNLLSMLFLTKNSSTNLIFTVLSLMLTFMNHHRQSRKSINIFYYVEFIIHLLIFFIFHLNLMIFIALRNFQIMRKTTSKKPQIAVLRNFINDLVLDWNFHLLIFQSFSNLKITSSSSCALWCDVLRVSTTQKKKFYDSSITFPLQHGLMLKSIFFVGKAGNGRFLSEYCNIYFEGGICEQTDKITDLILSHPPIIITIIIIWEQVNFVLFFSPRHL